MAKEYTKTVNVTPWLHDWIKTNKMCDRETFNDVLMRKLGLVEPPEP